MGLGNPGPQYAQTRHNAGQWFVDLIVQTQTVSFKPQTKFHGSHANVQMGSEAIHLLIPSTYMNESGRAVRAVAEYYNIKPAEILVAHDELDLPVGSVRLKFDGGHAGHNGLRDIISHLGTNGFHRLRIGIGHPGHRNQVHDYVLHTPSKSDRDMIDDSLMRAVHVLPDIVSGQLQAAMRQLHE